MMKSIPPDFTYAPVVDSKSTPTAPKPLRSEFRVGLYKDETHDQDGQHTAKTVGCSWACYLPGSPSLSCLTNAFSYSYEKFRGCQSKCLGVFQILIGLLCIAANIAWLVLGATYLNKGQGIWGGVLITIAGSFALAAGNSKSKCRIAGLTIWTLIAAGAAAAIIALTVIEIVSMVQDHHWEVRRIEDCEELVRTFTTGTTTTTTTTDYPGWSRRNDYGSNYDYSLQRFKECQSTLSSYVVDYVYYEKLALSIALGVGAIIVEFLCLWSLIICLKPLSCNCKRNQESASDSESAGLPQYTGYTVCPRPNMPDVPPYQSMSESSIQRSDLAVIQTGDIAVEKLPLTDHA